MKNSRFLKACRLEPVDATPVWFMRQAGRYMSEYQTLRRKYSLLQLCRTPDLATEVTLQPVQRLDVDAAILFSDLLLPFEPMGLHFDFVAGEGPAIENPVRSIDDIARLKKFEPREALSHVLETIKLVQHELDERLPLIGFAGAPFTLASYAIEGGHSNNFGHTKTLMYRHPDAWHQLCEKFSTIVADYLIAQIEAGVNAIQVFDSWVGALNQTDYKEFVLPHTRHIFDTIGKRVPTIHFGTGTTTILEDLRDAGGDVIGVDWRLPIDLAWERIGHSRAVQGNLDPTLLLGPQERLLEKTEDILAKVNRQPGHIFNLGHGILPSTPVENVQILAKHVHTISARVA